MRRVRHGINRVTLRSHSDPARAANEFLRSESDAFAVTPRHHFGDLGLNFGRGPRRQFFFANVVLLEKSAMIQKHDHFLFSLNDNREIRMRNQQMLADVQHDSAHVVHAHDQLGRRLYFSRDLVQDIARLDDVFFLFGRRGAREEDADVDFA